MCPMEKSHPVISCARLDPGIESRPCAECGVNTCDECRIHVFYNYLTEDPGLDQRRWWAGFLLQRSLEPAYPPKNMDDSARHSLVKDMKSLHHQDRFHISLSIWRTGTQCIDRILDLNLGRLHDDTHPVEDFDLGGNDIFMFLDWTANMRKERLCTSCIQKQRKKGLPACSCTLRKQFIDRWVCIHCYKKGTVADSAMRGHDYHLCRCGKKLSGKIVHEAICNWCKGEISATDYMKILDEDKDFEDYEEQDPPPGQWRFAKNHYQSSWVYCACRVCHGRDPHRGSDYESEECYRWTDEDVKDEEFIQRGVEEVLESFRTTVRARR
ncbi:hypothetical protein BDW02DRAFT_147929 [Decorospora gaudefroyi]|uniref:Uncharacterized protein n=1 Tax=Decorospora gaudefroyi TaxID=184978 RepID=A0A6A5KSU4_9PLEO|nr:hypothetical protein BDW02DRAFT_147929 [Decorospora gaudefroyi]